MEYLKSKTGNTFQFSKKDQVDNILEILKDNNPMVKNELNALIVEYMNNSLNLSDYVYQSLQSKYKNHYLKINQSKTWKFILVQGPLKRKYSEANVNIVTNRVVYIIINQ